MTDIQLGVLFGFGVLICAQAVSFVVDWLRSRKIRRNITFYQVPVLYHDERDDKWYSLTIQSVIPFKFEDDDTSRVVSLCKELGIRMPKEK